jgi:hypothetical protein
MNKLTKMIACLLLAYFMTGCAARSLNDLRTKPSKSLHVEVDQNYQRLYKNLLEKMNECMTGGNISLTARFDIRHSVLSELREAQVGYYMTNYGTESYWLLVDLKGIDKDKTKLDAYVAVSTWESRLKEVEAWATDPSSTCDGD